MNVSDILQELQTLGTAGCRRVLMNHGAKEPCHGVKIGDLQKIRKRTGTDYQLALDLYDSGIHDARYLAGLIADDARMTEKDLRHWLRNASRPLAGTTVAGVAAGSPHGHALALEWIDSPDGQEAAAGWATLSGMVSVKSDADLNILELRALLDRVERTIHASPDDVRYSMNGFIIAAGAAVRELTPAAIETAERIGVVKVDMGNTACQVPFAPDYLRKIEARGTIGKKRKSAKC
ncbi:MAG: DNA alkylation repair protein [Verrucomicrobiota bacterium]